MRQKEAGKWVCWSRGVLGDGSRGSGSDIRCLCVYDNENKRECAWGMHVGRYVDQDSVWCRVCDQHSTSSLFPSFRVRMYTCVYVCDLLIFLPIGDAVSKWNRKRWRVYSKKPQQSAPRHSPNAARTRASGKTTRWVETRSRMPV